MSQDETSTWRETLEKQTEPNRWYAVCTIQLGELVENGVFDWSSSLLDWSAAAYSAEQYERMCAYIIERYRFCEISLEPFYEWATLFRSAIVYELCPKYNVLYDATANGINVLQKSDEYEKRREVGSNYPETLLSGNSDYASTGKDTEFEHVENGDPTEQLTNWADNMRSIDQMFADELQGFFCSLYTVNMNGF